MLSVRELHHSDVRLIANYWLNSDANYLVNMGVDLSKMPKEADLLEALSQQLKEDYIDKKSYAIIWEYNQNPIGHCNVNKIKYGEEAFMHLHIWDHQLRYKGYAQMLIKMTLPYFFNNLKLKNLYCEPYQLNPSPNKCLEKVGFTFLKSYTTIPGSLNFEQTVNLWKMDYQNMKSICSH